MTYVDVFLRGYKLRRYFAKPVEAIRYAIRLDGCKRGLVIITFKGDQ
jgi:hypothetical protein